MCNSLLKYLKDKSYLFVFNNLCGFKTAGQKCKTEGKWVVFSFVYFTLDAVHMSLLGPVILGLTNDFVVE